MSRFDEAAELLDGLWRRGETIATLPPPLAPDTADEAFRIQEAFLQHHDSCGWKVGPGSMGERWAAAPLRGDMQTPPVLLQGSLPGVEVEVAFVLGAPLGPDCSLEEARAAIGTCCLAIELFRSRYSAPADVPFVQVLADNLNNAGVIVGAGVEMGDLPELERLSIRLEANGAVIATSEAGPSLGDLMEPLRWLAGYAADRKSGLKPGDVIITGARIGTLPITVGTSYLAYSALGSVAFQTA